MDPQILAVTDDDQMHEVFGPFDDTAQMDEFVTLLSASGRYNNPHFYYTTLEAPLPVVLNLRQRERDKGTEGDYEEAIDIARDLIGPDIIDGGDSNSEYVRGMCELLGDMFGRPHVELGIRKQEIARDIGIKNDI